MSKGKSETPIIKRLRRRFIVLAMVSLAVLLTIIVAGMNFINYNKVVSDADSRLDVLEQNLDMMKRGPGAFGGPWEDERSDDGFLFGHGGQRGPKMSMDEAEESRFFTVTVDSDGNVQQTFTDRISAVDQNEAEEYAAAALASGRDSGFADEFRYKITSSSGTREITFLDCGRTLDSFRAFLRASIIMSLAGLALVFAVICYFAGRIIRPVSESYEKQKRFITDAGHEIKTPLAIIKANLDLINLDPESADESVKEIGDQVDRLAGLTNDLVYLSRMEEGDYQTVMTELPLSDIVSETADSFEALAREHNLAIETDIEDAIFVKGETKELEKLMSILLENAVKYSPEGGSIKLGLKRNAKNAELEIRNDTDAEMDNERLAHVFERFYRLDESRNSGTGGHGIGLSMADAIVKAHGGRISARTDNNHDFIINISIPVA